MKPRPTTRLAFPLASAIAALLAAPSVNATNYYWDNNGTTTANAAATGTWAANSSTTWTTAAAGNAVNALNVTTGSGDDIIFAATGMTAGTITVSGTQLARSITFGNVTNQAYVVSGGTGITLGGSGGSSGIFNGSGSAQTISTPITLDATPTAFSFNNTAGGLLTIGAVTGAAGATQTINVNANSSGGITLSNTIANGGSGGVVGLTINSLGGSGSSGTVTLSGANTYTGATNILAGTVTISNASTFTNTSAISLGQAARLNVNVANQSLAKVASGGGVVAGSFLRYSAAQTAAGAGNGPGTIFGTVELNLTNVNPNYILDFGSGGTLTNLVTSTYTSALTLSGNASIDSSAAVATYTTGGITASTAGAKTLNLSGSNTGLNLISSAIGNGSGTMGITKGGAGTWVLSGTNTNTGNTRIDAGILQFSKTASLYNSTTGSWTAANIRVGNGGTLALNVGGAGEFTTGNVTTLLTNLGGANGTSTTGFAAESAIGFDTTNASGGTFTVADVLANSNGIGGGAIGLTKLGTGTLVLSSDNTYTGRTVISGGTLQLGAGGTTGRLSTSSSILNNGTLTINRSDAVTQGTHFSAAPITGTGAFIQAGAGTTTLNAANTFSGTTTVSAGTLALTNALALQNSALAISGTGVVDITGLTTPTFGGLSGSSNLSALTLTGYGSVTNLTLNPQSGSVTYSGIMGASGMTLTKAGAGTQVLTGANLYTGTTTINRGILTIGNGTTGSLNGTTGTALTFTGTGTFNVAEATGSTQGMGALSLSAGDATITSTAASASATQTVTFASLAARSAGATGNFTLATNTNASQNQIVLTGTTNAPLDNSGSNNQGIFFGTTEYARYDTTNNRFRAVIYGTDTNASAIVGTGATLGIDDATKDVKVSGNITAQTTASVNTLNLVATTTTLSSSAQVLSVNGILSNGGTLTTTGFVKTTPATTAGKIQSATAGGELVINAAGNLTLSASIQDNGSASSLTKSGIGTLTLGSSASTYSGATVVNAGTVSFTDNVGANTDTFFGTGPVTFNPGTTLALNRTYIGNNLTLNNATLTAGNSFGSTLAGTTTLTGISTFSITGNLTISGNLTGTGGLIKTGATFVPVNGTNTYTGPTTISGGGLIFAKPASLYNADSGQWTKSNITVNNGGSLTLKIGGSGEFSITQAGTIFGNLVADVNSNGLQAGGFFGLDAGTSGGSFTFSTNLTDSTGVGGGAVGFRFLGNNSMGASTLELTGTNTYSGQTILDRQGLLKVSSINSVFTNAALGTVHSASSSLGAPTTVATGTIQLGTSASFQGAGLVYTGTGETTDRVLSLGGGGGDNYRLDQSGTGNLKFISNLVMTDTRGTKNIVLQGSTAGTGELAGVIPNATTSTLSTTLTKSGTGTWTLSAANLYTGLTTVSGGALVLANANALNGGIGATGGLGALTFNGGVIGLGAGDFSRPLAAANTVGAATFTGAGGWAAYGANRAVNLGGASATITWATASTGLNGQTLILSNATATHAVDFQNPLALGTAARTVQVDNGSATIDGKLSGVLSGGVGGNLTKTGLGTLEISNTGSYTGNTNVNQGKLVINGNISTSTLTTVASGATLGGEGTVGALTVSSGAFVTPGNSPGILTVNGNYIQAGTYNAEITGITPGVGGYDQIGVTGSVNITSGSLSALFSGSGYSAGNLLFILLNDGTDAITGTYTGLAQGAVVVNYGGLDWEISYNADSTSNTFTGTPNGNDIALRAVPEPRAALLGGLGLLALLRRRRRN